MQAPSIASVNWLNEWFPIFEAVYGQPMMIRFGRVAPNGTDVEWIFLPHYDYDGLGGFAHILMDRGYSFDLPDHLWRQPLHSHQRILPTLQRMLNPLKVPAQWNPDASASNSAELALAFCCFDEASTQGLEEKARSMQVSLNSLLLFHAHQASLSRLVENSGPMQWMMPVNMRFERSHELLPGNHVGFLTVFTNNCETPSDIHNQVRQRLAKLEHWGSYDLMHIGRIIGRGGMKKIIEADKKAGRGCVGGFSNLGSWTVKNEPGTWLVCPPVNSSQPAGIGLMKTNGRLSITVQFLSRIATDSGYASSFLSDICHALRVEPCAPLAKTSVSASFPA